MVLVVVFYVLWRSAVATAKYYKTDSEKYFARWLKKLDESRADSADWWKYN